MRNLRSMKRNPSSSSRMNYRKKIRPETESNKCSKCSSTFSSSWSLIRHRRLVHHEEPGELKCLYCARLFVTKLGLTSHVHRMHSKRISPNTIPLDKKFKCSYCATFFKHEMFKINHEAKMHSGKKKYRCKHCNGFFNKVTSLKCHKEKCQVRKRMLTNTKHPAKLNKKKKPRRPVETATNMTKNGVQIVYANKLSCSYCPRLFIYASNKYRHELQHTGRRPYVCKFCEASYYRPRDRDRHERKCLSLTAATWCKFCDHYTFRPSSLEVHYIRVHGLQLKSDEEVELFRKQFLGESTSIAEAEHNDDDIQSQLASDTITTGKTAAIEVSTIMEQSNGETTVSESNDELIRILRDDDGSKQSLEDNVKEQNQQQRDSFNEKLSRFETEVAQLDSNLRKILQN